MAISSAGIGSNIDVNSLVSQLMAIERRPLDLLNQRKSLYNAELSAFGKISSDLAAFQSAVSALKNADDFKVYKATAADTDYVTASADSGASVTNHSLTITQLAKAQKLVSTTFADTSVVTVGTGSLTVANGASSFNVTIDSTNNTLDGIVNAINSASSNFGVAASIINDGTGYRLLFSPNETGTAYAVTISVTDTGDSNHTDASGLSRLYYSGGGQLTQTQAAQNAIITVDGLTGIQSASNTVTDVIQGVTLNLKKDGVSTSLDVAVDTDTVTNNLTALVTAYNKLANDTKSLRQKGGTLEADNTVLTIQGQLMSVFNTQATISGNAYSYLAEIGLSLQSNGTLSLNSADFKSALSSDMNSVVNLFTHSTQGFMQRFYSETTTLLQADGVVDAKNDGLGSRISDIDIRISQMETRLTSTERRLRKQFASLDALLGTLSSTTSLLLRQLG